MNFKKTADTSFNVSGSFPKGLSRKTWDELIRTDLKERKISKDISRSTQPKTEVHDSFS